mgnify:CR=1 FL=1
METGRPAAMDLLAATPIRIDMAPAQLPAAWPRGSGTSSRKSISSRRASPPPWPPPASGTVKTSTPP